MRVFLLDHHDSFSYNLVQALAALGSGVEIHRPEGWTVEAIAARAPTHLVLSPGPGAPADWPLTLDLIRRGPRVPLLGVCLGHQCIAEALGGRVRRAARMMHGKASFIHHDGRGIFAKLPQNFPAGRYHSLAVDTSRLPPELEPCAWSDRGELMALRHRDRPLTGVQFHPESFLTPRGPELLANFLHGT